MSGRPELRIDWATAEAARFACENWHYSGTLPANKSNYLGVWEAGRFVGAMVFGLGAAPSLGKPYGLGIFEVCELTRIALRDHHWPVSRMIRLGLAFIKKHNPGTRLCVSFADTFHGHHGGVYQASGWVYAGMTQPSEMIRLPNGQLADPRRFNGHGHNAPKPIPVGSVKIRTPGKHRYLMPLDDDMRRRIEPLRKPYPKRVRSDTSDTTGNHPVEGGAAPTLTLP